MTTAELTKIKNQVAAFDCKLVGLLDAATGETVIPFNSPKTAPDLERIYKLIPSLPAGRYVISCKTNPKHGGFKLPFDVGNVEEQSKTDNMLSANEEKRAQQSQQTPFSDSHLQKLGDLQAQVARLTSENTYLQVENARHLETISDLEEELDSLSQLSEKPSMGMQIMEGIAPVIPRLADLLIEKLSSPQISQQAIPVQTAPVIDYEQLAEAIIKNQMQEQNQ